jgi:hypothetical protein
MSLLTRIREAFSSRPHGWWQLFSVTFDDHGFTVKEHSRHAGEITQSASWSSVSAVCFQDGGLGSDVFHVYISGAPDLILVPIEALGGNLFWSQLTARGLFPEAVSAQAVHSTSSGSALWWPPTAAR